MARDFLTDVDVSGKLTVKGSEVLTERDVSDKLDEMIMLLQAIYYRLEEMR